MRRHGSVSLRMQTDLSAEDSTRLPGLEGKARRPADIRAMQELPSSLEQTVKLTPELFKQLDVDKSGSVDLGELQAIFDKIVVPDEADAVGVALTAEVFHRGH